MSFDAVRTDEFIVAACVPRGDHASGTLEAADSIRATYPGVAVDDIYGAAVVGDHAEVDRLLGADAGRATAPGGPYAWDALTYLSFSRYLRLRPSGGFVHAARALLDAGADPNTGFLESAHQPEPELTRLLLDPRGTVQSALKDGTRISAVRWPITRRRGSMPRRCKRWWSRLGCPMPG